MTVIIYIDNKRNSITICFFGVVISIVGVGVGSFFLAAISIIGGGIYLYFLSRCSDEDEQQFFDKG